MNFIFAGADTSAQSMSYLIVMLNRHPRVLGKIRDELRAKLPNLSRDGEEHLPSKNELSELTYLEVAIRESLRLNPPAAITTRAACEDVVMSDGTFVPKGTRVFLAFYVAIRSNDVWGDDALEFKPERWLDPEQELDETCVGVVAKD